MHKYSDATQHATRGEIQPERRDLCCTGSGYAGCVPCPRTAPGSRAAPTKVYGPKLAGFSVRQRAEPRVWLHSLWQCPNPAAAHRPFNRRI